MSRSSSDNLTEMLVDLSRGNKAAADRLLPVIYDDLREMAERLMREERSGHTLQPTALVHEAYLRLVDQTRVEWRDRTHFFAVAATAIRRILVDHARSHLAAKHGGRRERISLEAAGDAEAPTEDVDLPALDEAMARLADFDERKSRIVELRFFAGLSIEETGEVLGVSHATVERDWSLARAWLYRELRRAAGA